MKYPSKLRDKGNSIIDFPNNYIIVDIETTGLSSEWDSIIEVAAIEINNGEVVKKYQSFVEFEDELPKFIIELTGITNDMLKGAPSAQEVITEFSDFIGDKIIVGYNVNFDINFLYDYFKLILDKDLKNDYIDCLRISRKLFPEEKHHRLKDMVELLDIQVDTEHRALSDCETTKNVFEKLYNKVIEKYNNTSDFICTFQKKYKSLNANDITTTNNEFDTTHPLYGKKCVFTGTLEKMIRQEAMQIVVDLGGEVQNNVNKETNYLILGNNDYCPSLKGEKSSKQKKAESLLIKGQDIAIIPENVFYDMINQ